MSLRAQVRGRWRGVVAKAAAWRDRAWLAAGLVLGLRPVLLLAVVLAWCILILAELVAVKYLWGWL